ncbi:hypothetical protein ACF1HU_11445 [Streptomyces olivaceus]|uniref:hypothetical protein n=1 Tax=Streptomyces olivaceus TaxID=47716 RepID=UPI00099BC573|nr:hypothetical protein [Streptomyces olivaceus]
MAFAFNACGNGQAPTNRHFPASGPNPARLDEELAVPWQGSLEGRRHAAREGVRNLAAAAGTRHQLVFVDPLVATTIHLRHDLSRTCSPAPRPKGI